MALYENNIKLKGFLGKDAENFATKPDIKATLDGVPKVRQVAGLQLTNKGWEVPGT